MHLLESISSEMSDEVARLIAIALDRIARMRQGRELALTLGREPRSAAPLSIPRETPPAGPGSTPGAWPEIDRRFPHRWKPQTMQLIKYASERDPTPRVGIRYQGSVLPLGSGPGCLSEILHTSDIEAVIGAASLDQPSLVPIDSVRVLAPIDGQEVWGAGVTYERSKVAREQESERAASFYDQVYTAERPELFFKATPSRVVGTGEPVRVRSDTKWCVPEPELALVLSPTLKLVGYTIGNDMSARDIEGENPLYLPQAKVYDSCCALGPCITLATAMPPRESIGIRLEIDRGGKCIFRGQTSLARMARTLESLIDWLSRDNVFPDGVILLTGTGIIPPDDFSLRSRDVVRIAIDGIGTLTNPVAQTGQG